MKPHDEPYGLCSLDPVTLTGIALGLGAGGIASSFAGGGSAPAAAPTPAAPRAPAPAQQSPVGQRSGGGQTNTPSFIGSSAAPEQRGLGSNTLLGQP